jgi:hypothetical protein
MDQAGRATDASAGHPTLPGWHIMTPVAINCQYCGNPATFRQTSGHVYSRDFGPIWYCEPCQAWCGCHPDGKPLGTLANGELRTARRAAHAVFDPLVAAKMRKDSCSRNKARKAGYKWLSEQLGIEWNACHIALFDVAMCQRVVSICKPLFEPKPPKICGFCKESPATLLCDGKKDGKICSAPMCRACAKNVGNFHVLLSRPRRGVWNTIDHCPDCQKAEALPSEVVSHQLDQ